MSENYFQMVLQNSFKRNGNRMKQIWEHVKVNNKLIETGDLQLFIFCDPFHPCIIPQPNPFSGQPGAWWTFTMLN